MTPRLKAWRPDDEGDTNAARLSSAELQALLLEQLALGPKTKWKLRDALHCNEARVLAELKLMKKLKLVKVIGKTLDLRQWALIGWQGKDEPARPIPVTRVRGRYPRPLEERYADLFK